MYQKKATRMSTMLIKTLREAPADAELASHALMLRAGMLKRLTSGIYSYMPFLYRTMRKVENIIREEMDAIEGQEINMPVVHSAELWKESGRYDDGIAEMVKFNDRSGRDMVLGMTHEEIVTDIVRREVESYKQLPFMLYQIQTKFRDEPRARGGLIRVREFVMKDAYSFHTNQADLDAYYERVAEAYFNIYRRAGLDVIRVASDTGMMGGSGADEYMYVNEIGEDTIVLCPHCGYAANLEVATQIKTEVHAQQEILPLTKVATPGQKEILAVAEYLEATPAETMKTLIYTCQDEIILVAIRGDLQVNEKKLAKILHTDQFRLATNEEAQAIGLVPGFVSPIGQKNIKIICDDSLEKAKNLIAGANEVDYHFINANLERDFQADIVADLAEVPAGAICPQCRQAISLVRGVEVGNIFKLGTKYSKSMGANYLNAQGKSEPIIMGCYGIGIGRLVACAVEQHHDNDGIIWPMSIAPYQVIVVPIGKAGDEVHTKALALADDLARQGIETIIDDRNLRPGVKFKDADLIGFPLRLVLSKRNLENQLVEVKLRDQEERQMIKLADIEAWTIATVQEKLSQYL